MKFIVRIIAIALRHRWRMVGAYACMVGASAAYLLLPRLFGNAIDIIAEVLKEGDATQGAILSIALVILGLSALRGVLSFGQTYLSESLSQVVAYDIRNTFYNHVQRLSFEFHDRNHTANLMSRAVSDVENVRLFINVGLMRGPYSIAVFIIVSIILIRLDWRLGLLSTSFMPLVALQSAIVRIKMRRIWLAIQEKIAELNTILQENLTGVRVVKAFASEAFEEDKFDSSNMDVASHLVSADRLRAASGSFMQFTFMIALGLILWFGGWRVIDGDITPGELAQFIFYMQILSMPVRMAGTLVNTYARAASGGQRLFEILDTDSPVQELAIAHEVPRVRGHVRFENVTFGYGGHLPVLKDISFEARPGEVIALLGAPGSGKTTVVNLIPRFYDVTSGSVTIDGTGVRDMTLSSLRRNIGLVQQDVFLFSASIRENIAYGREGASLNEVIKAAKVAQLHGSIEGTEAGYETVIGERGSTLSGGQRQRLSIARAVLLDPSILILDDSTSSVDVQTEELIRRAMESVMAGRTTFVIAHRLSTVHRADTILVLDGGEIAERGTHRELLELGGLYTEIYELQLLPQERVLRDADSPRPTRTGAVR